MVTAAWMPSIIAGSLMRATPPSRRMSAGTRSSAITATAPASSAILACSGVTTSMMTPPRSISASPRLTRAVPRGAFGHGRQVTGRPVRGRARYFFFLAVVGGAVVAGGSVVSGRRRRGHVDRAARREQLDPGAAGPQQDRVAGGVDVLGGLGLVGAHPTSGAQTPSVKIQTSPSPTVWASASPVYCVNWITTLAGAIGAPPTTVWGTPSRVRAHRPVAATQVQVGSYPSIEAHVGSR